MRTLGGLERDRWRSILRLNRAGHDARWDVHAVVGNRRDKGTELQRRNADFLTHGDCANRNFRPAFHRLRQAARFTGKFDPGLLAESESADVLVKPLVSQPQRDFDGADIARLRDNVGYRKHAVRSAVADAHAVDDDRSHLAVEHFVGARDLLFQSGPDSDHFEGRTGLVDVADRAVFQGLVANFLPNIGIECGPVGERQNLSGVRVFHDHRAGYGVRLLHPAVEFAFGDVLDVLIDSKGDAVAGLGLLFNTGKPALARVHGNHQLSGLALQLLGELPLQPAQSLIVSANVAQNLRRQFTFWIEALGLFLEVDPLQVQRADTFNHFRISLTRHPAEGLVGAAVSEDDAGIVFRDARNQADGVGKIGSFRGHHEGRVHLNGHGQLTPSPIVDDAALRGEIEAALLLVLGAALELYITR